MTVSVLGPLLAADSIIIAGLAAYDRAIENALAELARTMTAAGHSEEQIAEALAFHRARISKNRGELHAELWRKALAVVADMSGPEGEG